MVVRTGGEDSDPYKGKKIKEDSKARDQQKKDIHDPKKKTGRGGADNMDDKSDY
jgi:hypothetical protein